MFRGPANRDSLSRVAIMMLLIMCLSVAAAEENSSLTDEQRAADFASFCQFVEDDYAYFDVKKTDWRQACAFYQNEVTGVTNRVAYVELLERVLGELYDHHAHLGTNTQKSPRLVPTQTDLVAEWLDGRAILKAVRTNSAAERAGLRPGFEVLAVDDQAIATSVALLEPRFLSRQDPAAREWALQVALAGRRDRDVRRVTVRNGRSVREFEFVASSPKPSSLLSHRTVGTIGYISIHNSLGEQALVKDFDDALFKLLGVRALIIDLRDTPSGGNSTVARGIIGRFVREMLPYQRHELVSEFRSTGIRRVWNEYVAPRGTPFLQPLIVLVGPWTGSMGEGLAIGLNATRGAPVLGEPMAHLLGALSETVLPHSKITVRVPAEKLSHINGTPREAFAPRSIASFKESSGDSELNNAIDFALQLSAAR